MFNYIHDVFFLFEVQYDQLSRNHGISQYYPIHLLFIAYIACHTEQKGYLK